MIFNISNPASPALVHQYTAGGEVYNVSVSGSLAYITTALNGLEILDISNPAQPLRIAQYRSS